MPASSDDLADAWSPACLGGRLIFTGVRDEDVEVIAFVSRVPRVSDESAPLGGSLRGFHLGLLGGRCRSVLSGRYPAPLVSRYHRSQEPERDRHRAAHLHPKSRLGHAPDAQCI